jgi:HlyD family secretion protein
MSGLAGPAGRVVATALLMLQYGCGSPATTSLPGTLERHRLELSVDVSETIVDLPVTEGTPVVAGTLLVALDRATVAAQLEGARALVAQREAQLQELLRGERETTRAAAVAARDSARAQRDQQVRERERLRPLASAGVVSRAAFDQQVSSALQAEQALRAADALVVEQRQGTRIERIEQARRAVEQAQSELRVLQGSDARRELRAPRDAFVDALPFRVGERPAAGATLVVLLESGAPFARVFVPMPRRALLRAGARARVRIEGHAGEFEAALRYIATDPEYTPYYSLSQQDRARLAYRAEFELLGAAARQLPAGLPLDLTLIDASANDLQQ